VALSTAVANWEWTVELDVVADRDGTFVAEMEGGDPVRVPVGAGSRTIWLRIVGGGPELFLRAGTPGMSLCVTGGTLGLMTVQEAPSAGG
jgi:hypothetical protein